MSSAADDSMIPSEAPGAEETIEKSPTAEPEEEDSGNVVSNDPEVADKTPPAEPEPAEPTPVAGPVETGSTSEETSQKDQGNDLVAKDPPTAPSTPLVEDEGSSANPAVVVSRSSRKRPPYTYNPNKVVLRFLFANKDGLTVTVECSPKDTVGEVKGVLLSVWPEDLPRCKGGDGLRLICMGKGMLMPDSRTLEDCQVPVFQTHATPINVSVRPEVKTIHSDKHGVGHSGGRRSRDVSTGNTVDQGCSCVIL